MESPRPRAPRIQIQHAVALVLLRLVRMASDNNLKPGSLRLQIQVLQIVQNIETCSSGFDRSCFREFHRPGLGIHVASHGEDRRNFLQAPNNLRPANIPCVNNQLNSLQRGKRLRPQQSVGIRNNPNPHES